MCYTVQSYDRRLVRPVRRVEEVVVNQQAPIEQSRVATSEGGGGGEAKKCVCSPTRHPGSFRCRHHHADYEWGCRVQSKGCK
ncbi:hypothetical protein RHMOL_Rhmol08G0295300 [Rhododendron molle]|uniref:Uncharacterized protein n=1 Tax=Rhododendron molle TaxID=49168 RepID=A0ACC0MTQ2_RHOML|nr:hypothetical protein RHMOL_Rhmol08G0295300 [Rhododendron molle]